MKKPLISVIIPTHNNADTIGVALRSILDQTITDIEVLLVDDSSTDDTLAVAQRETKGDTRVKFLTAPDDPHRYDIKLKRNVNAGWSARNAGLSVAQGAYITFQDGDDASLLNRLEIQLALLQKCNAAHITTNYKTLDFSLLGTTYDEPFVTQATMGPKEIINLARKTKGFIPTLYPKLNCIIPFHYKRLRFIHKLFFGSLDPYPGAGNSPFFKKEVAEKVQFRPLPQRIWPSFMGRGADRDFNFQVAETFGNSYFFDIPLYLWDQH